MDGHNQSASRKARSLSVGRNRPGVSLGWRRSGQGALLDRQIGMQVDLGGLDAP
jgi:hypothetical protein